MFQLLKWQRGSYSVRYKSPFSMCAAFCTAVNCISRKPIWETRCYHGYYDSEKRYHGYYASEKLTLAMDTKILQFRYHWYHDSVTMAWIPWFCPRYLSNNLVMRHFTGNSETIWWDTVFIVEERDSSNCWLVPQNGWCEQNVTIYFGFVMDWVQIYNYI